MEAIGTDKSYASSYGSHGGPDKGADSMFTYAKSKGADWGGIDTLPEVVGLALYKDGHVGYYVGNGEAVEWKSFADGCVKTKVAGRGWTSWYRLPFLDYGDGVLQGSTDDESPAETPLGSRLLLDGSEGSDVRALQELLLSLGYALPRYGADGNFGAETEAALRAFQVDAGLEADGKYGEKSHAAMMEATADGGKDSRPAQPEPPDAEKPPVSGTVVIVSEGGKVNVREGNGLTYGRITQLAPGTTCPYVATAENGWHEMCIRDRRYCEIRSAYIGLGLESATGNLYYCKGQCTFSVFCMSGIAFCTGTVPSGGRTSCLLYTSRQELILQGFEKKIVIEPKTFFRKEG